MFVLKSVGVTTFLFLFISPIVPLILTSISILLLIFILMVSVW